MAKVAFLGLGVMGYPMAGHLKNKGGHEVTVYNRTAAKAEKWVKQYGGKSAPTPKAAAEGQDFVMACVGNDNDLREVTLGENGAFAGMGKGKIFVDHTTASAADRARTARGGQEGRLRLHRRAGVGRPGRRRERRAHRDVRRRGGTLRARGKSDRGLCARLQPDRRSRRRPAHQDGQPDLHRRAGAGPVGGPAFRQARGPRHREGDRHHLQGRGAVLADGEPLQDHGRPASSTTASRSNGCARISAFVSAKRAATARTCRSPRWSTSSIRKCRRWAAIAGTRRA